MGQQKWNVDYFESYEDWQTRDEHKLKRGTVVAVRPDYAWNRARDKYGRWVSAVYPKIRGCN